MNTARLFFFMKRTFNTTAYRYPQEQLILVITFLLVALVIALTATATVCLSVVFIIGVIITSYYFSRSHHQALMEGAKRVSEKNIPGLLSLIEENMARLQVEAVEVFLVPNNKLNAYTFGLFPPKTIVLYSALFQVMDRDEIQFILGHEMGHIRLGHTWLNTLVGGIAGIPSSFGAAALLEMAFHWWNRACEFSADRAGLLACGKPGKAISALVKLEAGIEGYTQTGMQSAIERIEAEDDDILNNIYELLATHPMTVRRVDKLRRYAMSTEYRHQQELMNRNLDQ